MADYLEQWLVSFGLGAAAAVPPAVLDRNSSVDQFILQLVRIGHWIEMPKYGAGPPAGGAEVAHAH